MHDEFLHRLRKDPTPEFTARLQARLRRQSTLPRGSRAPSLLRTLLTLLLLGGTAFAVTWIVMRGVPTPVAHLYRHAAGMIAFGHGSSSARTARNGGIRQGWWWGTNVPSAPASAVARGGAAHSAEAVGAPTSPGSPAAVSGAAPAGGAFLGQAMQIRVVSSWSAYPYAAEFVKGISYVVAGRRSQVDLSVIDSDRLLASMCRAYAQAPAVAYTFAPAGSVSPHPCPGMIPTASPVVAIPIDYEAVALARSPLYGAIDLTRREVFLAMAKWVPDPSRPGVVHENPNTTWQQINASLGKEPIELLGPPLASPSGRSMIALLMQGGCDTYPWIAPLKLTHPHRYARICRTVRTDGVYTETSGSSATRLLEEPNALGIVGFWDLTHSGQGLSVSNLDGVQPTLQSIESGAYPASRELYVWFNRWRTTPNMMLNLADGGGPMWQYPDWALISLPLAQRQSALLDALRN